MKQYNVGTVRTFKWAGKDVRLLIRKIVQIQDQTYVEGTELVRPRGSRTESAEHKIKTAVERGATTHMHDGKLYLKQHRRTVRLTKEG